MFKMTYSQMAGGFAPTLQKLARMPLPVKISYSIKRITDAIQSEQKKMRVSFTKEVMEPYAKKNEKGEFLKDENGDYEIDDTQMEAFNAAQEEFGKKEFTIDRFKLKISVLENVSLSASELAALDPILEDPEEAQPAEVVSLRK